MVQGGPGTRHARPGPTAQRRGRSDHGLGAGFLSHPANPELRAKLRSGELDAQDYYRQLLRLVYRLIFLFVAEDRDLLLDPQADATARERYMRYYSTARLRRLAERQRGSRHADLWQGLKLVTDLLGGNGSDEGNHQGLGLTVLNGFLFSEKALPDLEASQVDNQSLLNAMRRLAFTIDGSSRRAVDYKNLGSEELGSVYESLLELHPKINSGRGHIRTRQRRRQRAQDHRQLLHPHQPDPGAARFGLGSGDRAGVDEAEKNANRQDAKSAKDSLKKENFASLASSWFLNLKVCDPACGSGHFLIAAAHRIARRLAQMQRAGTSRPQRVTPALCAT